MAQEEFVVSALKYRPSDWNQVVGQSSITTTLQNAIANEEIAKAYLFCGPRGVGKTTSARIFAKAINEKYLGEGQDLSFNVFELDAASNNSVEDIRNLIDQVRIQPPVGKYKVYVIDEVHMLSAQAFNAFLKTLEEPPPHAIFVLATTEKHKVLPTILSRCQIYDFSRIQVPDMTAHLASIADDQSVTYEEEALHLIAQKADGALRDALSLFDQMISFSGKHLTYKGVADNLNILDHDYYFRVCEHIRTGDISGTMLVYDEIVGHGFDSLLFITGLAAHLRDLLVAQDPATLVLLDTTDSIRKRYMEQAQSFDAQRIISFLELLQKAEVSYRASQNKRLLTEVALLQMCKRQGVITEPAEKKKPLNEPQATPEAPHSPTATPAPKAMPVATGTLATELSSTSPRVPLSRPVVPTAEIDSHSSPTAQESTPPSVVAEEPVAMSSNVPDVAQNEMAVASDSLSVALDKDADPLPELPEKGNGAPEPVADHVAMPIPNSTEIGVLEKSTPEAAVDLSGLEPASESSTDIRSAGMSSTSKRGRRKSRSVSLLDIEEELTPESDVEEEKVVAGDALHEPSLMKAWKAYAEVIKEQKKFSFYSTLTNRKPEIIDDNSIRITLENDVQMEDLTLERTELMTYIRQVLNNPAIQMEAVIAQEELVENIGHKRPRDQFMHMMTKNPYLKELAQRLDLEPEA